MTWMRQEQKFAALATNVHLWAGKCLSACSVDTPKRVWSRPAEDHGA